ncbi:uncharacterized protein CANTADRAFT_4507 [Suhomyces tanzawaensis NRRL Y-17324]|uniref:Spindle pole body-associated protein Vik1/Cik1 microtubule binding domain-containing protein n=1 Tax=Suhomyces tanzawaensis NRRL Y-17324 TaxID=984487 RepID=A0A1E4SLR9_9ASCO|nr:uncharacterized protein CANTADRAFT_4507 [Suhomyces tanzawaensis NRRL Y-17324]ODV80474.1 hypothetical protein CANTADRAFT_4507 [Suhomyces tanzawaensis NRRL Y-17324]
MPQHLPANITPKTSHGVDLHTLETQVIQLSEKIEDLRDEIDAIVREQAKVRHRIADVNYQSVSNKRTLEREIETSEKEKAHLEQMLSLQVQELEVKLDDDFNELKFNLQSEVKNAEQYRDDDLLHEIERLLEKKITLETQLDEIKEKNQAIINEESKALKLDLNAYVASKEEETDKLSLIFENKDKELNDLNTQLSHLQSKVDGILKRNEESTSLITDIQSRMNDYPAMKSTLLKSLTSIDERLNDTQQKTLQWNEKLRYAESTHSKAFAKQVKFDTQRMILENSIMDNENKIRVYLKYNNKHEIDMTNDTPFNKIFTNTASVDDISSEFSYLIKSSITGNNVSIIFNGIKQPNLLVGSITNSYKYLLHKCEQLTQWKFNFRFKSITINNSNKIMDLLNSMKDLSLDSGFNCLKQIPSQEMIIDDVEEFTRIIKHINDNTENVSLYIISVSGIKGTKSIQSDVLFVDITSNSLDLQTEYLKSFSYKNSNTGLLRMFNYAYLNSKCLFMSNVNDEVDEKNSSFINSLERIKAIDSPYKKK